METKQRPKTKKEIREEQIAGLKEIMPVGSTVYGIMDHVSASGMSAIIRIIIFKDNYPLWPCYGVHIVTGMRRVSRNGRDGIRVNGCGFNRLQHVVDNISYALYGKEGLLKYQDL